MDKEKREILRVLDAVSIRPSRESAKVVCTFFCDCLKVMHHPNTDQVGQELATKSFVDLIDHLLLMHAVEQGFFRLETDDVQITLRASYNPIEEEELDHPTLALLGDPPTTPSVAFVIGRNPDAVIDERMLGVLEAINQRDILQVRIEPPVEADIPSIPSPGPTPEQQETEQREPVQQVNRIIELLGLSTSFLKKNLQELTESTDLWQTEKAFVALTVVIKNIRIIIGILDSNTIDVSRIKPHVDRMKSNEYALGVLLVRPSTKKKRWQEDSKGYRDFVVGRIPQEMQEEAKHELLR